MTGSDVAGVLAAYGLELEALGAAQVGDTFSGDVSADELLVADPNAFLLGLLFTQGIPAERAWAGPYLLKHRLGTLDPAWLASHPESVRDAIQEPPMLHRFKETLPRWVVSCGARLCDQYEGHAEKIWPSGASLLDVVSRLREFDGIGRKKAVMGTEILVRHFGVDLVGRADSTVAYDVHVRRVFLRCGLSDKDSPEAIEAAASAAYPPSPGTLDLAAWLVGRQSCRPIDPRCDECRLGSVCPRRIWLTPVGVGARS